MNTTPAASESTLTRLSVVDRFLPGWIITAKALGLGLGRLVPDLNDRLDTVKIGNNYHRDGRLRRIRGSSSCTNDCVGVTTSTPSTRDPWEAWLVVS